MLGLVSIFICSWLISGLMVSNRLLKGVPDLIIMFFHGLAGIVVSSLYLLYDSFAKEDHLFILKYSPWQYSLLLLGSFSDCLCVYSGIRAAQSGKLGFIGLVQYVAVIYGFFADVFVFKETFRANDLIAVAVILATTVGVSVYKIV